MKHKYMNGDIIDFGIPTGDSGLELVASLLIAMTMAKENPSFADDFKRFLALETTAGVTQHQTVNPDLSKTVQARFRHMIAKYENEILDVLRDQLSNATNKEVKHGTEIN